MASRSRPAVLMWIAAALICASQPLAHTERKGTLDILHPAIVASGFGATDTCAHVTIHNRGTAVEYFLGAQVSAARETWLLYQSDKGSMFLAHARIAIPPGATFHLQHGFCLFLSGLTMSLEPDMAINGMLLFENAGAVKVHFMVDPPLKPALVTPVAQPKGP